MTTAIERATLNMGTNDRARTARVGQHRPTVIRANVTGYKSAIAAQTYKGAARGIATSLTNSQPPVGRATKVSRVGTVDGVPGS